MPDEFRPIQIISIKEIDPYTGGRNPKFQFEFQGQFADGTSTEPVKPDQSVSMFKTTKQAVRQALAPGLIVSAQRQEKSGFVSYWIDKVERIQGTAGTAQATPAQEPASQAPAQASAPSTPAASQSVEVTVDTGPITMCIAYAKDTFCKLLEITPPSESLSDSVIEAYFDVYYGIYQKTLNAATSSAQSRASRVQERAALLETIRGVLTPDVITAMEGEGTDIEDETIIDWWHQEQHHERNFRRRVEDELVKIGALE